MESNKSETTRNGLLEKAERAKKSESEKVHSALSDLLPLTLHTLTTPNFHLQGGDIGCVLRLEQGAQLLQPAHGRRRPHGGRTQGMRITAVAAPVAQIY